MSALLFLYRQVLQFDLPWLENVERASQPRRLPTVLTRDQVESSGCSPISTAACGWSPTCSTAVACV
jgi:hypothetical protein